MTDYFKLAKDITKPIDEEALAKEMSETITCALCKTKVNFLEHKVVRIQRGWFNADDENLNNIKYERFLCVPCFLNDEDLCGFFNKIGDNIR